MEAIREWYADSHHFRYPLIEESILNNISRLPEADDVYADSGCSEITQYGKTIIYWLIRALFVVTG
jgi:hypothetical protein